jgi:hypothetical protein
MYYVEYYKRSTTGDLIPDVGDRSVVILDGRSNLSTMKADAVRYNGYRRRRYEAYRICTGESFTRSTPVTPIIEL